MKVIPRLKKRRGITFRIPEVQEESENHPWTILQLMKDMLLLWNILF